MNRLTSQFNDSLITPFVHKLIGVVEQITCKIQFAKEAGYLVSEFEWICCEYCNDSFLNTGDSLVHEGINVLELIGYEWFGHIDIGCIRNRILPNYMVGKNKTTTKKVQYVTKKVCPNSQYSWSSWEKVPGWLDSSRQFSKWFVNGSKATQLTLVCHVIMTI